MYFMLDGGLAIDQNVVKINDHEFTCEGAQHLIHQAHERARVLDRPKGITSHSYNRSPVLKAVFHSSPTRIRTW